MTRVVVAGNDHDPFARKSGQLLSRELVLVRVALVAHIPSDHNKIRRRRVDRFDYCKR
jgi:hypothetical protein